MGRGQITGCPAIDELISAFYSYMDNEHTRKSALELISRKRGRLRSLGVLKSATLQEDGAGQVVLFEGKG